MKHLLLTIIAAILVSLSAPALAAQYDQHDLDSLFARRGEVYFKCRIHDRSDINLLTRIISIDNVRDNELFAYANRREFTRFLALNYQFTLLPHPSSLVSEAELYPNGRPDNTKSALTTWDFYPTYEQYVSFMTGFASAYPDLCRLDTVGTTIQGRLILVVRISKNVNTEEAEPQFLYTSSIHGDETAGYVMMLHLADYLLSNYGIDSNVTRMVNSTEIFINPLANPDGTYHGGNNTVSGAIRYNANYIDLNRNFPDPKVGQHPDGNAWQPETIEWMDYATKNHFTMSINFHGGEEVFNYPWDTWSKLTADDNWWQLVAREYADTVHQYAPAGYFTDLVNGVTNGYAWYEVNGGRQDYMNYWHHCREATIELSHTKLVPANTLLNYWNYHYRSCLNHIWEAHYGFGGIVTDTVTHAPVAAKVFIAMHDMDNSEIYSRLPSGFYTRPIYEGTYNVTFSATGYYTKIMRNVNVSKGSATNLDVQMKPLTYAAGDLAGSGLMICPNPSEGRFKIVLPENPISRSCTIRLMNSMGKTVFSDGFTPEAGSPTVQFNIPGLAEGLYFVELTTDRGKYSEKLLIRK